MYTVTTALYRFEIEDGDELVVLIADLNAQGIDFTAEADEGGMMLRDDYEGRDRKLSFLEG
jgi:hypothetical protein